MSDTDLIQQADEAFAKRDNVHGLDLLRRHVELNPKDAATWHRLANIEEQIGDWSKAGKAHYHCIEAAPTNPLAYIYAGHWLQKQGQPDAAASAYSLAQEIDPASLELWRSGNTAQPTAMRCREANRHLRQFMSRQHRDLFEDNDSNSRIARAVWVRTHDQPLTHVRPDFSPALFFIPDLQQKPWFERAEFEWAANLEAHADVIRQELHTALQQSPQALGIRPYLPEGMQVEGKMAALVGSDNWSAIDLYRDDVINEPAASLFPQTLELIDELPTYGLQQEPSEVFFSMLQPQWSIDNHYGLSNHSLTCHIGLDVPDECYIEVAGERRCWQHDKLLAFDDSYLHSAHNQSDARRIVLIFSVWHPSLNEQERTDIQNAFKLRAQWMKSRRDKLHQLLPGT